MTQAPVASPTAVDESVGEASAASGLTDRARAVLQQIRPAVQADGGDVELVEVTADGTARVRFKGACIGCPSSNLTLHMGIERALRGSLPEIARVVAVP